MRKQWGINRYKQVYGIQKIPFEWSRIESGSLSPWKHVWILFYAYFFFGLGPWNLKKNILRPCLIIFALSRVQGHPPYDASESWSLQILFWTIWTMILDSILDHCGNVFCWRSCGFWRTKESRDTKVKKIKKSSERCHNKLEFGVWPALDFLTFTIFTERSESVVCWGSCCGSCAYTWCGHLSCCWCLQCPCFILMLHPSTHWPKIQGSLGFLGGLGAGDVRCFDLKAGLWLFCRCMGWIGYRCTCLQRRL